MRSDADATATTALERRLVDDAAALYRPAGRFAWHFARGKLANDPLFVDLLASGAIPDASCLVDLGAGQGLLAAWLFAARNAWVSCATDDAKVTAWPASWPAPAKVGTYLGIDQSRRDVARARRALPPFARALHGDVRTVGTSFLDRCDVATLFDVLHYLAPDAQARLLASVHAGLPPWGVLLMRVGDGGEALASMRSNAVDLVVCAVRGHPRVRLHRRAIAEWISLLEGIGFSVDRLDRPADGRPQRSNVLLRARRPDAAAHPSGYTDTLR